MVWCGSVVVWCVGVPRLEAKAAAAIRERCTHVHPTIQVPAWAAIGPTNLLCKWRSLHGVRGESVCKGEVLGGEMQCTGREADILCQHEWPRRHTRLGKQSVAIPRKRRLGPGLGTVHRRECSIYHIGLNISSNIGFTIQRACASAYQESHRCIWLRAQG